MSARLDHLVVAARDLQEGRAWLEARLGVMLEAGGEHQTFGTHNLLLSLGDCYLEVIAINPAAAAPARPRWFELDTPVMQQRLAAGPALIHWVAALSELPPGPDVLELVRGENRWQLTVRPDGTLPYGGVVPSLIRWQTRPPSERLTDQGVRLLNFRLGTPQPVQVRQELMQIGFGDLEVYRASQAELRAVLSTARGLIEL